MEETHTETSTDYVKINEDVTMNIYRYKFSDNFIKELFHFSKIHQYDDRNTFKDAWKEWTEENDDIICGEIKILATLGYDGDVLDKMYKSSRYYFRKKGTEKKDPTKRRTYIGVSADLLEMMDSHIHRSMMKPSEGFTDFCKTNVESLRAEVANLCGKGIKDADLIKEKIKKTYKNRYFIAAKI